MTSDALPGKVQSGRGAWRGAWAASAVSTVVAFAVNAIGVSTPAAWQDEGATWIANQRSVPQLFSLLRGVDAVHGLYYLIMRVWQHLFGDSVVSLRMFSVAVVALGAGLAVFLAAETFGHRAALWAGLVYGVLPQATWASIEARSYAFSATAVTAAMLAFWVAIRIRRWYAWTAYALLVVFAVHLFMFAALAFVGLGVAIFFIDRGAWRGAAVSTAAAVAACIPFVLFARGQSSQIAWLTQYTFGPDRFLVTTFWGGTAWAQCLGVGITAAALAWALWSARAAALRAPVIATLGWLVLPTAFLVAGTPLGLVYIPRYVTASFPALALLVAFAVGSLPRAWQRWVALALVVAASAPAYLASREVGAKASTLDAVNLLESRSELGDGLYIVKRDVNELAWAFPDRLGNLTNLSANKGKDWRWKTLSQPSLSVGKIDEKLAGFDRVWLFAAKYYDPAPIEAEFAERGFTKADDATTTSGLQVTLVLMTRAGT